MFLCWIECGSTCNRKKLECISLNSFKGYRQKIPRFMITVPISREISDPHSRSGGRIDWIFSAAMHTLAVFNIFTQFLFVAFLLPTSRKASFLKILLFVFSIWICILLVLHPVCLLFYFLSHSGYSAPCDSIINLRTGKLRKHKAKLERIYRK